MKRKIISISAILILLIITIYNSISLATTENEEKTFFEVDNTDISLGDDLLININTDKIDYENFKVVVTSNIQMDAVTMTEDSIDGAEVNVESNDEITLIGNKTTMNVNQITLKYSIPDNVTVGAKLIFTAKLTNIDDETIAETSKEITVNVVEKQNSEDQNTTGGQTNEVGNNSSIDKNTQNNNQNITQNGTQTVNMQSSAMGTSTKSASSQIEGSTMGVSGTSTSTQETVVYNGSSNNYLSTLEVSGYNLNTNFSKTNSTYFITAKDTTNLNITANAEDSTATVKVYGDGELTEGTNKVLISVTAENGNVRTYRIYVTIES